MITKIWKELLILIGIFGAIWYFLSLRNYEVEENPFSVSQENEEKLADFMKEHMMDLAIIENDTLSMHLDKILSRLEANMDTVSYDYQLHVVDNHEINAFTTLNGNIYIQTGLIDELDGPEELAVIIAHEIGHAEKQHVVQKIIKTIGIETLFSILSGGDAILLSEVSKIALSTSFDRKKEEEADDFALSLAVKSEINPRRLGQFFLRLKSKESSITNEIEFISTHPLSNDRIKKSSDFELPEDFVENPIDLDWKEIQRLADN